MDGRTPPSSLRLGRAASSARQRSDESFTSAPSSRPVEDMVGAEWAAVVRLVELSGVSALEAKPVRRLRRRTILRIHTEAEDPEGGRSCRARGSATRRAESKTARLAARASNVLGERAMVSGGASIRREAAQQRASTAAGVAGCLPAYSKRESAAGFGNLPALLAELHPAVRLFHLISTETGGVEQSYRPNPRLRIAGQDMTPVPFRLNASGTNSPPHC